ncbi:MAG: hypothetical protein NTZ87_04315 [Candidatus Nomurabacteria bacterium]|nr:hypothetical protein [Candidatus Nomurabacteria bacterium]
MGKENDVMKIILIVGAIVLVVGFGGIYLLGVLMDKMAGPR